MIINLGQLPSSLGELSQLKKLSLQRNSLTGTIPTSLADLSGLIVLDLDSNILSGTIPTNLGNLTQLQLVFLYANRLTGVIPTNFGYLSELQSLYLFENLLTGTIPTNMELLANLREVFLQSNRLSGTIPSKLCELTQLQTIDLDSNLLSGAIPSCIGNLTNLQTLFLYTNYLVGSIPLSLGSLTNIQSLYLYSNQFTGTLPASIGYLTQLQALDFHVNKLTGTIPDDIGLLSQLQVLNLNENLLTGTIPQTFGNLSLLQVLYLNSNSLNGVIPTNLSSLTQLELLSLHSNHLTGRFPFILENLTQLQVLNIDSNELTGVLSITSPMSVLKVLHVDNNWISGSIPGTINVMTALQELSAYNNLLSGSLPIARTNDSYVQLVNLQLSNNLFSGSLPVGLLRESLQVLYLDRNFFSGSIPLDWFTQSKLLKALVLAGNCLSGTIPLSICSSSMYTLVALDGLHGSSHCETRLFWWDSNSGVIVKQGIYGTIPSCLFEDQPQLQILQASGNGLTGTIPDLLMPNLSRLVLSNNRLDGSLPANVIDKVIEIDLSFNRITGTLGSASTDELVNINGNRSVTLDVNRLSGHIPITLMELYSINILQGNMFGCKFDHSDIPHHDPSYKSYDCGSDTVNETLYLYVAMLVVTAMGVFLGVLTLEIDMWKVFTLMYQWLATSVDQELQDTMICELQQISNGLIVGLLVAAVLLLPMFVILSHFSTITTHRYVWILSAAYLHGFGAAVSMLVVFGFLLGLLMLLISTQHKRLRPPRETWEYRISSNVVKKVLWTSVGAVLVLLVNMSYVSVVNNGQYSNAIRQFIALLLSVFKLGWNQLLFYFVQWNNHLPWLLQCDVGLTWLMGIALFNNLLVPYLAEALVSPNCFLYALTSAPNIDVSYPTVSCNVYTICSTMSVCEIFASCDHISVQSMSSTTIVPIFEYSFQCSSSLLSAFAQVFLFRFLLCGLVQPMIMATARLASSKLASDSKWREWSLKSLLSLQWSFLGNMHVDQERNFANRIVSLLVLNLVLDVAIVLTFGMLFPLLAVVGVLSILKDVLRFRLLLGERLVTEDNTTNVTMFIDSLAQAWKSHRTELFETLAMIVWISSVLLSWTVFDTFGDVVGVANAIWLVMVMPLLSLIMFFFGGKLLYSQSVDTEISTSKIESPRHTVVELIVNPMLK
jgi:Leucine-rich repeat (LRR) protein